MLGFANQKRYKKLYCKYRDTMDTIKELEAQLREANYKLSRKKDRRKILDGDDR